jgi:DNA repair protein RecO (recombination protein O)
MYKTEAIILRQRRFGEADRFLTIYTPTLGKIEVKAKGVRKTTSRMSGHLQPLTRCMLSLAQGHVNDVVTGCETLESFQPLRDDLERLSRALYTCELADRMVPERVQSYPTYRLLVDTLQRLTGRGDPARPFGSAQDWGPRETHHERESHDLDTTLRFYEMRLVDQCGFRPELEHCAGCGSPLEPVDNFFAPVSGGAVCRACVAGLTGTRGLSLNALKVLRLLQRGSYNDVMRVRMDPELADEIERHLRSYIVSVLERDVNSAGFIERLRREGARQAVEV